MKVVDKVSGEESYSRFSAPRSRIDAAHLTYYDRVIAINGNCVDAVYSQDVAGLSLGNIGMHQDSCAARGCSARIMD